MPWTLYGLEVKLVPWMLELQRIQVPRSRKERWCSQHWRQNRRGETESLVRAHLRGETVFLFDGMGCRVLPSQYDLERNEEYRAQRKALRAIGRDRRRRAG